MVETEEEASRKRCAEMEGQAAARLAAATEAENACEATNWRLEAESSALRKEKMMMDDAKNVTYLRSWAIVGESSASTGSLMIYTPVWGNQFAAVHKALRESLTVEKKCDAPWSIVRDCKKGLFSRGCVAECLMLLESSLSSCIKIAGMPEALIETYLTATWVWSMKNEQKMQ